MAQSGYGAYKIHHLDMPHKINNLTNTHKRDLMHRLLFRHTLLSTIEKLKGVQTRIRPRWFTDGGLDYVVAILVLVI